MFLLKSIAAYIVDIAGRKGFMSKTHAELLGCPHCGKKPTYAQERFDDPTSGEIEIITTILCVNPDCFPDSSIEEWNTRVNKEAEFLKELKKELKFLSDNYSIVSFDGVLMNWLKGAVVKIEQFQAEQKVSDE